MPDGGAGWTPAHEIQVAGRFGVGPDDWRDGLTYRRAAERSGKVFEMELPAGTLLFLRGREVVLQSAAVVRTGDPPLVIERREPPGAPEAAAVRLRLVDPVPATHRRTSTAHMAMEDLV